MNDPDNLHIVCPHCDSVNRLPRTRLAEQPNCGKCAKALFTGEPIEVNAERFNKHIARNDIPVLVDFWAEWCGPCKAMAPAYKQASGRLEPQVRLLKLNTETAPDLSTQFNIRSIPTLALFAKGKEVARQPGAMDAGGIAAWTQAQMQRIT